MKQIILKLPKQVVVLRLVNFTIYRIRSAYSSMLRKKKTLSAYNVLDARRSNVHGGADHGRQSSSWTIRGGEGQALEALVNSAWKLRQGKRRK